MNENQMVIPVRPLEPQRTINIGPMAPITSPTDRMLTHTPARQRVITRIRIVNPSGRRAIRIVQHIRTPYQIPTARSTPCSRTVSGSPRPVMDSA
jgi:hypothetical protein